MSKHEWWVRDETAPERRRRDTWLEDFDFEDYRDRDTSSAISRVWNRYGGSYKTPEERVIDAQRLTQGIVDTFATGDQRYTVTYDRTIGTAGTDLKGRKIVVTPKPLFDSTLTPDQANEIMTALTVHETWHVKYGRATAAATRITFPENPTANRISNALDDKRIEARGFADYPGFVHTFDPALEYVAKAAGELPIPSEKLRDPLDVMVAAVRYPRYIAWAPETVAERDWWQDWADRWTRTDSTTDHVAGVREALDHIRPEAEQKPEPQQGEGSGGESGQKSDQSQPGAGTGSGSDGEEDGASGQSADQGEDNSILPVCMGHGADAAAQDNGLKRDRLTAKEAQEAVVDSRSLSEPVGMWGARGRVRRSPATLHKPQQTITPSGAASSAIRAAFQRSRTGHFETERGHRSGRIDSRALSKIGIEQTRCLRGERPDFRLFSRRQAPSIDRYRVWLLVDCSSSMAGRAIIQCAEVASALAAATRQMPTVGLDIWGWTTGSGVAAFSVTRVYGDGDPISNVDYLTSHHMGGTPDEPVMEWAIREILRVTERSNEKPVIIMASDGDGYLMADTIEKGRRAGVQIVSVAIGQDVDQKTQQRLYGPHGYIPWAGSIAATAAPLGRLIGRIAQGKGAYR